MVHSTRLRAAVGILMGLCLLMFLFATQRMLLKEEPFSTWCYCFAWWSYMLFMELLLHCRPGMLCHVELFLHELPAGQREASALEIQGAVRRFGCLGASLPGSCVLRH